jgi:glycosyltransferase involved in cell wall biosynthesis
MLSKPTISVIIPCYNSGSFLPDAIKSILSQEGEVAYDIFIVDDGSTDQITIALLNEYKKININVVYQENKGPAAARNAGVRASSSKYLLFLDSDNKIRPSYISKAIKVLESDKEIGVVYGKPTFFGESSEPRYTPGEFNIYKILEGNNIDMCAVVRREAWESVGGFDEDRILIGHEDWDLWIMLGARGWKFNYINEFLFDYRVRNDSVIVMANQSDKVRDVLNYFHIKHRDMLLRNYDYLYRKKLYYEQEHKYPFRLFFKYFYRKYLIKLFKNYYRVKH